MAKKKVTKKRPSPESNSLKEVLVDAYRAEIKKMYGVYLTGLIMAQGDEEEIALTGKRFKAGVRVAGRALDDCIRLSAQA